MINSGLYTSNICEWSTPLDLFADLNDEFHFTLDPCATDENHKCSLYFTKIENGLVQDWHGYSVFCNPPYGREIGKWVEKASLESYKSHTSVVMLLPVRTDTRWFHDFIYHKAEIRFLRGRLKFGESRNSAPFPSMIVIFKYCKFWRFFSLMERFARFFSHFSLFAHSRKTESSKAE